MFVYTIKTKSHPPLFKIGYSANPLLRLKQLQTGCGIALEFCHVAHIPGEMSARRLEKALHDELRDLHTNGGSEWFGPSTAGRIKRKGRGSQRTRDRFPACAEFCDKRMVGTPDELLEKLERMLSPK